VKLIRSTSALDKIIPTSTNHSVTDGLRAIIKQWEVVDPEGSCSEIFMTGDSATIRFYIDVLSTVNEIQAGILIRTVEGVSAFGTSSVYHGQNYLNAKKGTSLVFDFDLRLDLCPGNYFVTLAIAEAISHGDMSYLDRKTDVIVLKIDQARVMGSGIAALKSNVSVTQVV
jgi:lipopolysaccharide transport system ATP-binding protein